MLRATASLVNGSAMDLNIDDVMYSRYLSLRSAGYSGKQIIEELWTDDWGPPPSGVHITGSLESGAEVKEYIPYR